jgi:hypothetical protein
MVSTSRLRSLSRSLLFSEKGTGEMGHFPTQKRFWAPEFLLRLAGQSAFDAILSGPGALFYFDKIALNFN